MADGYHSFGGEWFRKDVDTTEDFEGKDVRAPQVWVANIGTAEIAITESGSVSVGGIQTTVESIEVNISTAGPVTLRAAITGPDQKIRVIGFWLWTTLNTEVEWLSGSTVIRNPMAWGPRVMHGADFGSGIFLETAAGEALRLQQTGTAASDPATIRGTINIVPVTP